MGIYIKKQVAVEAIQFTGYNWKECLQFMSNELLIFTDDYTKKEELLINTKEGTMKCSINDYIIKEPFPTGNRDFYICKQDIFEKTYDLQNSSSLDILYIVFYINEYDIGDFYYDDCAYTERSVILVGVFDTQAKAENAASSIEDSFVIKVDKNCIFDVDL